ncbi:MAG: Hsp33 family molecular chaperone HslO [Cellvibrionaceae bacterium]
MPADNDLLHRFVFDNTDIRGEIVTLQDSINELFARQSYPLFIQSLMGEFISAAALLASTLKFDGLLTLQARGDGPVPLIMAEVDHNKRLRGIVKISDPDQPLLEDNLPMLIGKGGVLSITIDPDQGNRYQGIVPLDAPSLADCLEHYFEQSEQLPTRIWLTSDGNTASGLLLQRLPQQLASESSNAEAWENRVQLANTTTSEELLTLDHQHLLTRLFHEEGVRFYDPIEFAFGCSCSKQRSSHALQQLGHEDAEQLAREQGIITIDCQFCGFQYTYNQEDISAIFAPKTRH